MGRQLISPGVLRMSPDMGMGCHGRWIEKGQVRVAGGCTTNRIHNLHDNLVDKQLYGRSGDWLQTTMTFLEFDIFPSTWLTPLFIHSPASAPRRAWLRIKIWRSRNALILLNRFSIKNLSELHDECRTQWMLKSTTKYTDVKKTSTATRYNNKLAFNSHI